MIQEQQRRTRERAFTPVVPLLLTFKGETARTSLQRGVRLLAANESSGTEVMVVVKDSCLLLHRLNRPDQN